MNVLITGGNGYIAQSLAKGLKSHKVTLVTRKDFDLANSFDTRWWLQNKFFDVCIHTAVVGGSRLKEDDWSVLDDNLRMYYNLVENRNHFKRLIHFGSGAELYASDKPYGYSKKVIAQSILNNKEFYNLRIYGVFDENELDSRFIKANIKRYIDKVPMEIHQDKDMDFFYMEDLVTVVNHYITEPDPDKEFECTYDEHYDLVDIANMIMKADSHFTEINIRQFGKAPSYISPFQNKHSFDFVGLEEGIKRTYNKIKCNQ